MVQVKREIHAVSQPPYKEEGHWQALAFRVEDESEKHTPCDVSILPLPNESGEGLFVRVEPPREPVAQAYGQPFQYTSCDIVLCIDVSFSMNDPATPPAAEPGQKPENTGMSILDLVKHAVLAIISTLGPRDRLSIVTFSTVCRVLQTLVPMTAANKRSVENKVRNSVKPDAATALWNGIRMGLQQFQADVDDPRLYDSQFAGNIPAMMVLSDGRPLGLGSAPDDGYAMAFRRIWGKRLPATIHTFAFGYNLQGGLLPTIAELGGGSYSFIPDPTMLGTVFNHSVANLQSTFACNAVLTLTYPADLALEESGLRLLKETAQETTPNVIVTNEEEAFGFVGAQKTMTFRVRLNNLQYGHPRNIFLRARKQALDGAMEGRSAPLRVKAELEYIHVTTAFRASAETEISPGVQTLSSSDADYHLLRARLVCVLSELLPLDKHGEHKPIREELLQKTALIHLLRWVRANKALYSADPRSQGLVEDLIGNELEPGQVEEAIRTDQCPLTGQTPYRKWGQDYLPSLRGAHEHEHCVSFKDLGTQLYGVDSPLFLWLLERLSNAFDG
jgi:hypothetical protein